MKLLQEMSYADGIGKEIRECLKTTKVVLLSGYREGDLLGFYDRLSDEIGEWVPMDEDVETEQKTGAKWIEIKYDPGLPNSYRHSSTRQPLHTDGSYESGAPEVSFFYCIKAAPAGGATTFIDSEQLLKVLNLYCPDLYRRCHEVPVTHAKGNDSKTKPIISEDVHGTVLTWNYFRVMETTPDVTRLRQDFHHFLEEKVVGGGLCFPCPLQPGEAVFFNDERLLHGRNAFVAHNVGDRYLLKGGLRLK
jgi:alpha-ketoglutarate-dependent taurine dioxygenase